MVIGVPKEIKNNEKRVSLTPCGAKELISLNHKVQIQSSAGVGSGFSDSDYQKVGADLFNSVEEIYSTSNLILKVKEPQTEELKLIQENQIVFTFFHFAADEELTKGE